MFVGSFSVMTCQLKQSWEQHGGRYNNNQEWGGGEEERGMKQSGKNLKGGVEIPFENL